MGECNDWDMWSVPNVAFFEKDKLKYLDLDQEKYFYFQCATIAKT